MDFKITMTGVRPVLMHSARLANPLDQIVKAMKAISGKRTKTDDDHIEMARLEFAGSMYIHDQLGPYIPGENIERCLVDAGKITKKGTALTRGLFIKTDFNPLVYRGPRTIEELWADENFRHVASVKVQQNRVMRTRPMFKEWEVTAEGVLDTSVVDPGEFGAIAETAGNMIGLGDYRPRYGRFVVNVEWF
jgi:hypothetical protein